MFFCTAILLFVSTIIYLLHTQRLIFSNSLILLVFGSLCAPTHLKFGKIHSNFSILWNYLGHLDLVFLFTTDLPPQALPTHLPPIAGLAENLATLIMQIMRPHREVKHQRLATFTRVQRRDLSKPQVQVRLRRSLLLLHGGFLMLHPLQPTTANLVTLP